MEKNKKAAQDASIFIYSGHGSGTGILPKEYIENSEIVKDIKLRKNALVIFNHVCFGAGSSASDFEEDIGLEEAENRVLTYAETFFKIGAACYYANNYYDAAFNFLKNFYEHKSLKQCYELSLYYSVRIEKVDICAFEPNVKIGISSDSNPRKSTVKLYINNAFAVEKEVIIEKSYDIAFVSKLDYNLDVLLKR